MNIPDCCGLPPLLSSWEKIGGGDIIGGFGLNELRKKGCCWLFLGENEEVAKGDVAILSEVDKLENIVNASGKFGGVAGVLAGVISYTMHISQIISKMIICIEFTEYPAEFRGIAASWK